MGWGAVLFSKSLKDALPTFGSVLMTPSEFCGGGDGLRATSSSSLGTVSGSEDRGCVGLGSLLWVLGRSGEILVSLQPGLVGPSPRTLGPR